MEGGSCGLTDAHGSAGVADSCHSCNARTRTAVPAVHRRSVHTRQQPRLVIHQRCHLTNPNVGSTYHEQPCRANVTTSLRLAVIRTAPE